MSTDTVTEPTASRRRDTVLAAVEAFRALDMGMNMSNILVFLYVAENEGISVTELATVSGLKKPTASRSVRALTSRGSRWALPPYLGLVELCAQGPARNSKTMRLTQHGRNLCDKLDQLIADPVRISIAAQPGSSMPNAHCDQRPDILTPTAPVVMSRSVPPQLPVSSPRARALLCEA